MALCPAGHRWVRGPGVDRCPRCHAGREHERNQDPYRRLLLSARWQKTRELIRARDQGRCRLEGVGEPCGGRIEVHHLVSVRQAPERAFDLTNCVCLCRLHHEDIEHGRIVLADLSAVS
jgi:5-methylcytosine-specific restriction endonuclease McrA